MATCESVALSSRRICERASAKRLCKFPADSSGQERKNIYIYWAENNIVVMTTEKLLLGFYRAGQRQQQQQPSLARA